MVRCSYGKEYIGETGRFFNIRLKEHASDVLRNRTSKYALEEHSCSSSQYMCMEEAKLIKKEDHYFKRKIKEVVKIKKIKTP